MDHPEAGEVPRSQKFLLADRIENLLLDILEHLIDAAYSKKKGVSLRAANLGLEKLRYLVRLSKDLKLVSLCGFVKSRKIPFYDRGRDIALVCDAPPSEPDWRISRIRLSGRWFTYERTGARFHGLLQG